MHIFKLPLIALIVVLSSIFFVGLIKPVRALSFTPVFGVSLLSNSADANSDVTLIVSQASGDEILDKVTFKIPAGWIVAPGTDFKNGATIGSGNVSFVYQGATQNMDYTVTNIVDTAGHLARWNFAFPGQYCCLTVNVDGTEKTGYSFIIDPLLPIETPLNFTLTLSGIVDGVPFLTNSGLQGDYAWVADFTSVISGDVSKSEIINIPTSKTPTGTNVAITLSNGAEVVFANVTTGGLTSIDTQTNPPPEGTGQFQISPDGLYYDYNSTATFECPCLITLPYDPKTTPKPAMYHLNTTVDPAVWEDVTVKIDDVNNTITGETKSFSFFTVGEPNYNVSFGKQITKLIAKKGNPFPISGDESLNIKFNLLDNNSAISSPEGVSVQIWKTKDASGNNIAPVKVSTINPKSNKKGDFRALLNLEKSQLGIGTFEIRIIVGFTEASQADQVLFNIVGHVDDETRAIIDSERD